uniref:Uncharacterized protein n=1 Tax=Anopheles darlingi TaxID=43151 RepID=A0A2M4DCA2_ANODA
MSQLSMVSANGDILLLLRGAPMPFSLLLSCLPFCTAYFRVFMIYFLLNSARIYSPVVRSFTSQWVLL